MTSTPRVMLDGPPIATGTERNVYIHPEDDRKLIKLPIGKRDRQNRRDIDFYRRLARRGHDRFCHIPRYFGQVQTNLGQGIVVELIRDDCGEISRSMRSYLQAGVPLAEFYSDLATLKQYLLDELIIFNYDMLPHNLMHQQLGEGQTRLVAIDGLGDVVKLQWLNRFPAHVRAKIERRWKRMQDKIEKRWGTESA